MTWQSPGAFWLLLAVPLALAIFLYRRRFPVLKVPSLGPWSVIGTPVQSTSWRNLLRRLLVLLLELSIILALILAAAHPRRSGGDRASSIVILDCSATMLSRTVDGSTRFDQARHAARSAVAARGEDSALILAGDIPQVIQPGPGTDLLSVLNAAEALHTDSDLAGSLKLARAMTGDREDIVVTVLSDFAGQDPELLRRQWDARAKLTFKQLGDKENRDAGIIHASRVAGDNLVRGELAQIGFTDQTLLVVAEAGGKRVGSCSVPISAGRVEFEMTLDADVGDGLLELRIDTDDALAINNRFLLQTISARRRIALISDRPSGLAALVSAADNVELREFTPADPGEPLAFDLVIADRTELPRSWEGCRAFLFVACTDPFDWVKPTSNRPCSGPSSWAPSHPVLRDIQPEALQASQTIGVAVQPSAETWPIVESADIPLVMEARIADDIRAIYLLFDPFTSPAGSSLAFPLLILNTIDHLSPAGTSALPYLPTGQGASIASSREPIEVITPSGQPADLIVAAGSWRIPQLLWAGRYSVTDSRGTWTLPVNYTSSRPAAPLPSVATEASTNVGVFSRLAHLPLQSLIAAAAFALVALETALACSGRVRIQ